MSYTKDSGLLFCLFLLLFEPYSRILCTVDVFVGLELPDLHGEKGGGQPPPLTLSF